MLKLWLHILLALSILGWFTAKVQAEELVNPASDIFPPEITVIAPLPDSILETATPWIEVVIVDTGSGIQRDTLRLYVDNIEVTAQALLEETDVTGQAVFRPVRVKYQPRQPLGRGNHQVLISVRDKAQNLAELRWSFKVKDGIDRGFQIKGTNTLQVEQYPNAKVTDNLDLNLQGWIEETQFRFNLRGHAADYPGAIPDYTYGDYHFYRDSYTLGVNHRNAELIFGNTVVPLESELLQISSGLEGHVVNYRHLQKTGNYQWSLFSGDVGVSSGFRGSTDSLAGLIGDWNSNFRMRLHGFYLQRGAANKHQYLGIGGNTVIENLLFRFETVHGSRSHDLSGNALALHLDRPFGHNHLGFDYAFFDSDYPASWLPNSLASGNAATERYVLRSNTRIGTKQALNLQWALTTEEPDDSSIRHYRQNYYLDYQFLPTSQMKWTLNYQEDFKYHRGSASPAPDKRAQTMVISFEQQFDNDSRLNTSLGLTNTEDPNPNDASKSSRLFLAWTYPFAKYNLTPSAYFWSKEQDDGDQFTTNELQLTFDFGLDSQLSRSRIAVFYRSAAEDEAGKSNQKKITGLETAIYLKTTANSSLAVTYNHSLWEKELDASAGQDRIFRFDWKIDF